jgi:ABC-type nickel/cobalt efflux system permease component RcnA
VAYALVAVPAASVAHPLGNFSISHYTALTVGPDAVSVVYLLDMAEIPTFQEMQEAAIAADPAQPATARYLEARALALAGGLRLEVDGRRLPLAVQSREIAFPPGAGDLPTLKIRVVYRARLDARAADAHVLTYRDDNYAERAGWKEIVATSAAGAVLRESSVPRQDRSRELAEYPTDLIESPPQQLTARLTFARSAPPTVGARVSPTLPGGTAPPAQAASGLQTAAPTGNALAARIDPPRPGATSPTTGVAGESGRGGESGTGAEATAPAPRAATARPRDAFSDLIATKELGLGIVLTALGVAAVLGAFHALEPGHGKTVVAAYLVGARGTAWHALVLGLVVTASHTAGVYLLGGVTFYASQYVVPERLYPWLAATSGLTIAVLGAVLFVRRWAGLGGHSHHHHHHHHHGGHHHDHDHHDHDHAEHHAHPHAHDHAASRAHAHTHPHRPVHAGESVSLRGLVALGISGGIVPCPAALVVLLSALSLRRVGFGLLLIVAFSLGLALVLIAIGMLMVYARRLMSGFREESPLLTRWLPLTSSAVITVIGVAIAVQALTGARWPLFGSG